MKKLSRFSLYQTVILSIFLLASCKSDKKEASVDVSVTVTHDDVLTLTPTQLKNAELVIGTLSTGEVASHIKATGIVDVPPNNMVAVNVPLGGFLKQTHLMPGMYVSKGQVIARLQDEQYIQLQQDYLMTKASLHYTSQDYKRQRDLNQSKAVSDKQYQQAVRDYNMDNVKLQSLASKLRLINIEPNKLTAGNISNTINIYAPISGYVSRINANVGSYVAPSLSLFELVNPSNIHLNLKVFEKDLNSLSLGQKVIATTNENPHKRYDCNIILISQNLNEDRSVDVHCKIQNADKTLKPGMYMNADIEAYRAEDDVLPEDAVVNFEGKHYVFESLDSNKFKMVAVDASEPFDKKVRIMHAKPLQGKKIVLKNAYTLLMALKNTEE